MLRNHRGGNKFQSSDAFFRTHMSRMVFFFLRSKLRGTSLDPDSSPTCPGGAGGDRRNQQNQEARLESWFCAGLMTLAWRRTRTVFYARSALNGAGKPSGGRSGWMCSYGRRDEPGRGKTRRSERVRPKTEKRQKSSTPSCSAPPLACFQRRPVT